MSNSDEGLINVYSVKHKRTFCYIAEAVEMIQLLAESDKAIGEAYKIGNDDEEITMGESQGFIKVKHENYENVVEIRRKIRSLRRNR